MGARKRLAAEKRKEARKNISFAVLKNCPTSPRKMRLMADLIRGKSVDEALDILKFSSKEASGRLEKLLMSAIANWQAKNENVRIEDANLMVSEIFVDSARMLKRIQPAPQGRAHRIRKRSNHVTVTVESANVLMGSENNEQNVNVESVNAEEESEN
jgi:large subunit ribosomal protein L22